MRNPTRASEPSPSDRTRRATVGMSSRRSRSVALRRGVASAQRLRLAVDLRAVVVLRFVAVFRFAAGFLLVVAVPRFAVVLLFPAALRAAVARPPSFPPFFAGLLSTFLPRPDPLFFPPPVILLTVAHARASAVFFDVPRFSYPSSMC